MREPEPNDITNGEVQMEIDPYRLLADRLDAIPNGYPPTENGAELRVLQKLYEPDEAELASHLRLTLETAEEIATRLGREKQAVRTLLKGMTRKRLIIAGRTDRGFGFGLMPFAFGIYEMQFDRIDEELARLFEEYYLEFGNEFLIDPQLHRVLPVNETIRNDMEVQPYENATNLVTSFKAWGVVDCLCRQQQALIGDPCDHPLDVCMIMSPIPGAFDTSPAIRSLTLDEALGTLKRAADAGLVHSVSNNQKDAWYICNCCPCSCGILRGMQDLGLANVIAQSSFVNQIDADLCTGCEICLDYCHFGALSMDGVAVVNGSKCVGCGLCVAACPDKAFALVLRPEDEVKVPVATERDWLEERAEVRGIKLEDVL